MYIEQEFIIILLYQSYNNCINLQIMEVEIGSYERLDNQAVKQKTSQRYKTNNGANKIKLFLEAHPFFKVNDDSDRFATTFDELPEIAFDDKCIFLGKFTSFIINECKSVKSWNTQKSIVSAVHGLIISKFPHLKIAMELHYSRLLKNIKDDKLKTCSLTGESLVNNALLIKNANYEYYALRMFETECHSERALMTLDLQSAGRISEVWHFLFFNLMYLIIIIFLGKISYLGYISF